MGPRRPLSVGLALCQEAQAQQHAFDGALPENRGNGRFRMVEGRLRI